MGPIETERLLLRELTLDDAEAMYANWASDPRVAEKLTWAPHASINVTKEVLSQWAQEYKTGDSYRLGIVLKEENKLIGAIDIVSEKFGFKEIGYVLAFDYWGKGLMTEAATAFRDAMFELGFRRLVIRARVDNIGSTKVIFKLGGKFYQSDYELDKKTGNFNLVNTFFVDDPAKPPAPLPNPFRCSH